MSEGDVAKKLTGSTDDWPLKAANTVVGYVDKTKLATTGKALVISRAVVYLLSAALLGLIVGVLLLIFMIRLLASATAELPFISDGEVWLAYYIMAAIFIGAGLLLWRKRGK
ncbi:MAG: hypothetical protein R2706_06790 [Acidimicrobiales bacterium]